MEVQQVYPLKQGTSHLVSNALTIWNIIESSRQ